MLYLNPKWLGIPWYKPKWSMITISDHRSSRWKDTSGSQPICFKESCRWIGKRRTQKNANTWKQASSEEDTTNPHPTKRLPLAPRLVSSLAPVCQKGGEGEIYLRSLPSLPTLPSLEDGSPVREISLPHGLPVSQTTQVRDLQVLPKVVEIAVQSIDIPP